MSDLRARDGVEARHACGHLVQYDRDAGELPCAECYRGGKGVVIPVPTWHTIKFVGPSALPALRPVNGLRRYLRAEMLGVAVWEPG